MYTVRFKGYAGNWEAISNVYNRREAAEAVAERLRTTLRGLEVEVLPLGGLNYA